MFYSTQTNSKLQNCITAVDVIVPNGDKIGTLDISNHCQGTWAIIPVITNAGSANWQQSIGVQNGNLLVIAGNGVITGYDTTVRLYKFLSL